MAQKENVVTRVQAMVHKWQKWWSAAWRHRRSRVMGFFRFYRGRLSDFAQWLQAKFARLGPRRRVYAVVTIWTALVLIALVTAVEAPFRGIGIFQARMDRSSGGAPENVNELAAEPESADVASARATSTAVVSGASASGDGAVTGDAASVRVVSEPVTKMARPLQGEIVERVGWYRHPEYRDWRYNAALRVQPAEETETVVAVLTGTVKELRVDERGTTVVLDHGNEWESSYGSLEQVYVRQGDVVERGRPIGLLSTGVAQPVTATGNSEAPLEPAWPALAFTIRQAGQPIDPLQYLAEE